MRAKWLRREVWGLLSILETNRIANARFTDEIEFYLPNNNATNLNREICILILYI